MPQHRDRIFFDGLREEPRECARLMGFDRPGDPKLGWRSLVVWECKLRRADRALARMVAFLEGS